MQLQNTAEIEELLLLYKNCLLAEDLKTQNLLPIKNEVAKVEGKPYFKVNLKQQLSTDLINFLLKIKNTYPVETTEEELFFIQYINKKQQRLKKYHQKYESQYLVGFPVIYYKDNKQETKITPLFNFSLHSIELPSTPITKSQKNQQTFTPPLASSLILSHHIEEEQMPYWLNDVFCVETLGLQEEKVRSFRESWANNPSSPLAFLSLFCEKVLSTVFEKTDNTNIFSFLADSLQTYITTYSENLPTKTQVYPYAIVFEKTDAQPTRQLLNDINAIIQDDEYSLLIAEHPFKKLLLQQNTETNENSKKETQSSVLVASYDQSYLSNSQKQVIQAIEQEQFVTAEGPPGTGKTHMIRAIGTTRFIQWISQLDGLSYVPKKMEHLTLITSTNNHAVDTALEGFYEKDCLPIALRVGNRFVISKVTLELFYDYTEQLKKANVLENTEAFYEEQKRFHFMYNQVIEKQETISPFELYQQARKVHSLWVFCNKSKALRLLELLIEDIENARGLSRLYWGNQLSFFTALFPIIGTTLLSLRNIFPLQKNILGQVIIDEAGQCAPSYVLPAFYRSKHMLLVGDTKQLEPITNLTQDELYNISQKQNINLTDEQICFFSAYQENTQSIQSIAERVRKPNKLQDHFRCRKEIMELSNQLGQYNMTCYTKEKEFAFAPFQYIEHSFEEQPYGNSWKNEREANITVQVILHFIKQGFSLSDMALITPYKGQWQILKQRLFKANIPITTDEKRNKTQQALLIGTVHQIQGGEKQIILFSNVLHKREPLFLNAKVNLLNVAVSRAKESFVFIGSLQNLQIGKYTELLYASLLSKGSKLTINLPS